MKRLINYIVKLLKKIKEAIKNPDMPQTLFTNDLKTIVSNFSKNHNIVNGITFALDTVNGIHFLSVNIYLLEKKNIELIYTPINNVLELDYKISLPTKYHKNISFDDIENEALQFDIIANKTIWEYFKRLNLVA